MEDFSKIHQEYLKHSHINLGDFGTSSTDAARSFTRKEYTKA